jgi:two-component system, chemotaxis family, protein-glutamate methylesterase/glutaminase
METRIRVLVVDDSLFMRKAISEIIASDSQLCVVGTAKDGMDGLKKINKLQPDVVILDIDMPRMNGLTAVRHIMIQYPLPIVVFSSLFTYGDVTFDALELGVVDFIPKPSGMISGNMEYLKKQIVDRIKIASGVNIKNIRRVNTKSKLPDRKVTYPSTPLTLDNIIAVGAGFSGTNSVIRLVSQLSPNLPSAIIASIEMSPKILPAFVEKFNTRVSWDVAVVEDGQEVKAGVCYIGSNENTVHMVRNKNNSPCFLIDGKSADPLNTLFKSSVGIFNLNTIGVMLTGLGDDGADGFSRIQAYSGITIAQDAKNCVYPNLTQNAIDHGAVTHAVGEDRLPGTIESSLAVRVDYKVC